jgi:hypothetical protein
MLYASNVLRWDGGPGHYEVHYLTLTEPESGVGIWIRYAMLAPLARSGVSPSCALWFAAMNPHATPPATICRKQTFAIDQMRAQAEPFELRIAGAVLTDAGMAGGFGDVAWDLRWTPGHRAYEHVHPALRRLGVAKTVVVLPHADLSIDGSVTFAGERLQLSRARGAQGHLWGSKHASTWAWAHCNDFRTVEGEPATDTFVDGVSVFVRRLAREVGPSTPVVGRLDDHDFFSTSPVRIVANASTFALTGWRFEAVDGARKLIGEVDADREQLVGVTYHDPDGEVAYCYNTETASMRLHLYERARQVGGWRHRTMLTAPGRAHYEYGQRDPVPEIELQAT